MNWKEKTLDDLRKSARVEPVSCRDDQFVVSIVKDTSILRTLVRLDESDQTIHYENCCPHVLSTVPDLMDSMSEHLDEAELA